jgi:hypothetical protein
MAVTNRKHIKSKYKHVSGMCNNTEGKVHWFVKKAGVSASKFETERGAAIAVDKLLISKGLEPINILKRK